MTVLETIKTELLPKILPTKEENQNLNKIFNSLEQYLQNFAEKLNLHPNFIQNHGSTGIKQTHLRGTSDLDIFIGLNPSDYTTLIEMPPKNRKQALKDLFLSYVNEWFIPAAQSAGFTEYQLSYAEHPYLIITHKKYEIDIVGCFDLDYDYLLTHGPITAVDRTPWHSKIIAEKLSDSQKEEVRLLKAFLQANFVYGDKNTLGRFGFTGFSAEILILHFQEIKSLFSEFEELDKTALDFFNRPAQVLRKTDRFKNDFLIIVDPVDKNRNLAASISKRAYKYALFQMKRFLKSPSIQYFIKKPPQLPNSKILTNLLPHLVVIEFISDSTVHYTELRDKIYSACGSLRKLLESENTGEDRFGKTLFEVYFEGKIFTVVFYCERNLLTPTYIRRGPPKNKSKNVQIFCSKHPDAYYKDGFYYVSVERDFRQPLPFITNFFQGYKQIKGLKLSSISQKGTSLVGQRALSLMISCVLPLHGVIH
ncbi:MAG: hypothetical protein HWN66_13100 [Candidatus Helarchaeota archaeon]|nr:hypothetical protein [Candidatus Helarchaeota archaeon]